jgi:hypothetical protein
MADPIIALQDVKDELDIDAGDTNFDTRLSSLISDVIAEAESEMEAKLEAVTDSVCYLNGGVSQLFLPHLNVTAVVLIEDVDRVFDGDAVDAGDYTLNSPRGIINKDKGIFVSGKQVIKATYNGGYTQVTLPRELKRALIIHTAYRWRRRKDPGLTAVVYPDGSVNKYSQDEWLPNVKRVLERYGRIFL